MGEAGRKARAPLYARQRRMLALLDALGGSVNRTDFQKLLFLYCQETDGTPLYDFVPYRFGAFSFTSYADRRKLQERGLLTNDVDWRLTESAPGRCCGSTISSIGSTLYNRLSGTIAGRLSEHTASRRRNAALRCSSESREPKVRVLASLSRAMSAFPNSAIDIAWRRLSGSSWEPNLL